MAEDSHPHAHIMRDVWFVVGLVVVLLALWYWSGGPSRADLHSVLLGGDSASSTEPTFSSGTVAPPPSVQY